ncbi:MAG TPA: CorA family divalent cation transporter, partial [Oscillospiraceae bacterium]|nr:CorA family divalent cation transporter [Oscillospiraceae bacterium]
MEADGYKLILATHEDSAKALEIAGIKPHTSAGDAAEAKTARFESMDAYDYASFLTPDTPRGGTVPSFVEIFLNRDYLLVFGEAFLLGKIKDEVEGKQSKHLYFEQTFVSLYEHFLKKDQLVIETIEDEIEKLEERTTQKKPEDHTAAIISLRKRLLALDRYYKAVYDVFEGLEENQNGFYSSKQIKLFGVYKNKIDRIILDILNQ